MVFSLLHAGGTVQILGCAGGVMLLGSLLLSSMPAPGYAAPAVTKREAIKAKPKVRASHPATLVADLYHGVIY